MPSDRMVLLAVRVMCPDSVELPVLQESVPPSSVRSLATIETFLRSRVAPLAMNSAPEPRAAALVMASVPSVPSLPAECYLKDEMTISFVISGFIVTLVLTCSTGAVS